MSKGMAKIGTRSLGKARSRGRIDVLAAAIQAIGLAAAAPARASAADYVLTELVDG